MKRSANGWAFMQGFQVQQNDRPYLDRLRMIQTPLFGIYLHRIHGPDRDRGPHDHPWWFASLVLSGSYFEHLWDNPADPKVYRARNHPRWSVKSIRRSQAHAIQEVDGCLWTLVLTGPRHKTWRFWIDGRPVDWKDYSLAGEMAGSGAPDERAALWGS